MRLVSLSLALALLASCAAADRNDPAGGGGAAGDPGGAAVPDIFYEQWEFRTMTLYPDDGGDPTVSSAAGMAQFKRDHTYAQDYTIGSLGILNHYEGTYAVTGADAHVAGGFKIRTTDQDKQNEDWGVAVDAGTKGMALTLYKADGRPDIIMGLKLVEK